MKALQDYRSRICRRRPPITGMMKNSGKAQDFAFSMKKLSLYRGGH